MRCDEWSERLAPYLSGEIAGADRREAEEHLAACDACRREVASLAQTWEELGRLPAPEVPSRRMRARLAASLATPGRRPGRRIWRLSAAAVLLAAGFLAGWIGRRESGMPAPAGDRYVLLLHDRPGAAAQSPEQSSAVVAEYKAWARRLRREGKLVGGEKLEDGGALLARGRIEDLPGSPGRIGGYFVIVARTRREAQEIARDCPHAARGGVVELRRIEDV
jgi:hypothetical protein